ncbi:MAG: alpha/beta hydrolase-fold protein [Flavobacteriales bacterium]
MRILLLFLALNTLHALHAADTLRFHSEAFGVERTVVVHTPEFHRYASEEVKLPVIIVLDGQHEWFVDPVLNDIRYLQYTHLVPQAIVVTVPLADRYKECALESLAGPPMPLVRMLTEELPTLLAPYHPGTYTVLVGHSFSASFALYAFLRAPEHFAAVIALSPLDHVKHSLPAVAEKLKALPDNDVLIAVGGPEHSLDGGHYSTLVPAFEALGKVPQRMSLHAYPSAGHTSLPIIAVPELLTTLFHDVALRDSLAPVDMEYRLLAPPPAPAALLQAVERSLTFRGTTIPWEVAEINGLASRVEYSGHTAHAIAIYRRAVQLYPGAWGFHASLGDLLVEQDHPAAIASYRTALQLLQDEPVTPENEAARQELQDLVR